MYYTLPIFTPFLNFCIFEQCSTQLFWLDIGKSFQYCKKPNMIALSWANVHTFRKYLKKTINFHQNERKYGNTDKSRIALKGCG